MDVLNALREAIEEELQFDDRLRGKLLNVVDSALEKKNGRNTGETSPPTSEGLEQAFRNTQARARREPNVEQDSGGMPDPQQADEGNFSASWGTTTIEF